MHKRLIIFYFAFFRSFYFLSRNSTVTRIFSNRIAVYLSYSPARNSATSSSVEFMT